MNNHQRLTFDALGSMWYHSARYRNHPRAATLVAGDERRR